MPRERSLKLFQRFNVELVRNKFCKIVAIITPESKPKRNQPKFQSFLKLVVEVFETGSDF